jgi:hypothetical protein
MLNIVYCMQQARKKMWYFQNTTQLWNDFETSYNCGPSSPVQFIITPNIHNFHYSRRLTTFLKKKVQKNKKSGHFCLWWYTNPITLSPHHLGWPNSIQFYISYTWLTGEPGSSVSSVRIRAGRLGDRGSIFPPASVSRLALGPTQPPAQWVPGVLSTGLKCGWGVTLNTYPHLVLRSRMRRSYTSSPNKRLHGM